MKKELLILLSSFLFICNAIYSQQTVRPTAREQSEKWVAENVFPYFNNARFLTEKESSRPDIKNENNITVFEAMRQDSRSVWGSHCYQVRRNGVPLFENELSSEELFNYFVAQYEKISVYADSIGEQIVDYLGPLKNTTYFVSPLEELPPAAKEQISKQSKATCLFYNVAQVSYLGKEFSRSKLDKDRHSKLYTYNLFFAFDNDYSKISPQTSILAVIVFLDKNMNILNGEVLLNECNSMVLD